MCGLNNVIGHISVDRLITLKPEYASPHILCRKNMSRNNEVLTAILTTLKKRLPAHDDSRSTLKKHIKKTYNFSGFTYDDLMQVLITIQREIKADTTSELKTLQESFEKILQRFCPAGANLFLQNISFSSRVEKKFPLPNSPSASLQSGESSSVELTTSSGCPAFFSSASLHESPPPPLTNSDYTPEEEEFLRNSLYI